MSSIDDMANLGMDSPRELGGNMPPRWGIVANPHALCSSRKLNAEVVPVNSEVPGRKLIGS
ncbi:hypothetical protein [Phormidium sp. CCY1219]|uniref:hypothetical protein n=1 Tax=Phormidium sp. CCY1219 TaxID=2886104 RepID=UPI002D1F33CE|nr:hypothetical protein [Phormidium sp. CCY1219]MEB3829300.1 hypothetical protein [Phormidium sp. CCY1219]